MPSVTTGFPRDLLLALQLSGPLLFSRDLLRHGPFLGLAALTQRFRTVGQGVRVDPRRCLAQPRRERLRRLALFDTGKKYLARNPSPCMPWKC